MNSFGSARLNSYGTETSWGSDLDLGLLVRQVLGHDLGDKLVSGEETILPRLLRPECWLAKHLAVAAARFFYLCGRWSGHGSAVLEEAAEVVATLGVGGSLLRGEFLEDHRGVVDAPEGEDELHCEPRPDEEGRGL